MHEPTQRQVVTALLPQWSEITSGDERWKTTVAVVIDILRASTTIVTALAQGARGVVPFVEVEQAEQWRQGEPGGLLGGERGGVPIAGFDFGNSPRDYTRERVEGKLIGFTTTNGTRALEVAKQASSVVIGAFVNASAVLEWVRQFPSVLLVCAGTNGRVTREDVLFAGWMASHLRQEGYALEDASRIASGCWLEAVGLGAEPEFSQALAAGFDAWQVSSPLARTWLVEILLETQGGRNLSRLGLANDLHEVARFNAYSLVPRWNAQLQRLIIP